MSLSPFTDATSTLTCERSSSIMFIIWYVLDTETSITNTRKKCICAQILTTNDDETTTVDGNRRRNHCRLMISVVDDIRLDGRRLKSWGDVAANHAKSSLSLFLADRQIFGPASSRCNILSIVVYYYNRVYIFFSARTAFWVVLLSVVGPCDYIVSCLFCGFRHNCQPPAVL